MGTVWGFCLVSDGFEISRLETLRGWAPLFVPKVCSGDCLKLLFGLEWVWRAYGGPFGNYETM